MKEGKSGHGKISKRGYLHRFHLSSSYSQLHPLPSRRIAKKVNFVLSPLGEKNGLIRQ
jgi:hypothetical protein